MMINKEQVLKRRKEFLDYIANNTFVRKHYFPCTWISGEDTTVYPIEEWRDSLDIQWKNNKPCDKWIDSVVKSNSDLIERGYFDKTDSSCPSCVIFKYKKEYQL